MARSFGLVENKISEADFFLGKIEKCKNMFHARFYLSAFVSAVRSITFALQASMSDVKSFKNWYASKQELLTHNELAKFFLTARNETQKLGIYHIDSWTSSRDSRGNIAIKFYFRDYISQEYNRPEELVIKNLINDDRQCSEDNDIATLCKNPSPEDKALTQRIVDIFDPLGIKVLDHIIVGGASYSSMMERGDMPHECKRTANYDAIALSAVPSKEKQNRFKHTPSR